MNLEAFENRVLPAKNKLYRFALRFLGNEEEAKDVVQEVLIRVWNGREQMNEIQNWEACCMRITRNLSLDLTWTGASVVRWIFCAAHLCLIMFAVF